MRPDSRGPRPRTAVSAPVRKRIARAIAIAFAIALIVAALARAAAGAAGARPISFPLGTMGTIANLTVVVADSAAVATAADRAHRALARVDSLMSNWTSTSEVARINRDGGSGATPVHPEVARVLDAALRIGRDSDGAFDITVEPLVRAWGFLGGTRRVPEEPELVAAFARVGARHVEFDPGGRTLRFARSGMSIDLGGIAKGHGVDVAAQALREAGITDALVDLSGNMRALGRPAHGGAWRIGIRDPRDRTPYFARLELADGRAIATSGKYEQFVAAEDGRTYGHIMDPRTGRPAEGLIAVTVLAPTAMDADAWGTALFVLGLEGARRKAKERDDLDAVLVEPGAGGVDIVWVESTLKGRVTLEPNAARWFRIEVF